MLACGNLKIWLLVVGCSYQGWTQSGNSIQARNYVCLDTSSLMHYITSKDQVTYAWGLMSIGQSYKKVHMLCSGYIVRQSVGQGVGRRIRS